jgi:hypothetical protein
MVQMVKHILAISYKMIFNLKITLLEETLVQKYIIGRNFDTKIHCVWILQ